MQSAIRALALASALLAARALFDGAASEAPNAARAAPLHGAARLLYGASLDANREPPEALALLPGIGPKRAEALVAARPLCSLAEVDRVPGFGPATLRALSGHLAFLDLPCACGHQLRTPSH